MVDETESRKAFEESARTLGYTVELAEGGSYSDMFLDAAWEIFKPSTKALNAKLSEFKYALFRIGDDAEPVYTTGRDAAVRKGLVLSGGLKHYKVDVRNIRIAKEAGKI